ncbi:PD-(D/E)XK nuclease family protein [Hydrogenimonas sp.]
MKCIVFSTSRRIRDYIADRNDTLLPKLYTMEEFLRRIVVVDGRAFVDEASRVLYLYRAIRNLDIGALGFNREFLSFLQNSTFLFRFFEETFAERVSIGQLRGVDTYADFEDHLSLLERIYENYASELEKEGLVDRITIGEYRLNEKFLAQFESIDIHVDGYLSRFETELLDRIETPLWLHFTATPFNGKLIARIGLEEAIEPDTRYRLEWSSKRLAEKRPLAPFDPAAIDVAAFSERIDQAAFVLERVERFIEEGADPDRVAVILPDETFAEYLKLFDSAKNFNYAMGTPFVQSPYYRRLADLYDALSGRSESAKEKAARSGLVERFARVHDFASFIAFLDELPISPREHEAIDETKFRFRRFGALLEKEQPLDLLHAWLQRLEPLHLDDVGGGRVTVMGLLESRGKEFDGVVIVDFNEEVVPKVGEKDLFLNSAIRRHAGMPTRTDKESLQKNYYYLLLRRSRRAAISYVKNEEASASRFLRELGLEERETSDRLYRPIIAPAVEPPRPFEEVPETANPFRLNPRLTPTKLKDYLTCARRFYYKYILEITKEREEERNIGSLIHASLEAAVKSKERFATAEEYYAFVMDGIYRSAAGAMQRLEVSVVWEERLRRFCERDFGVLRRMDQPVVEEWCRVAFEGFTLSAKIDRVDVGAGTVRAIDYKTSRKVEKLLEEENDYQLLFYRLWAESAYPEAKIETLYLDLFGGKEIGVESSAQRERLGELLGRLSAPETVRFEKTDDIAACRFCLYKRACGRE